MELYQLYNFLNVAKYENISKAAQELHTSQPSVSKAIQALEDELKINLFNRNGKRISLTRGGKIFENRLIPILEELDSVLQELRLQEFKNIETIRINALSGTYFLPAIIKEFKKTEPDVFFEIKEERENTCWDICIRSVLPEISYTSASKIFEEKILLAVHKDSWIAKKQSVSLHDLKDEIFIFLCNGTNLRELANKRFREEEFFPRKGFECDTFYMLQHMVQEGLGVALWPQYTWGKVWQESAFDQVRLIPLDLPDFTRSIYLLRPKDAKPMPIADRFCQLICHYFEENGE